MHAFASVTIDGSQSMFYTIGRSYIST